jgi:hypothetical protein
MLGSWATTATYLFKRNRFRLSVPIFEHFANFLPSDLTIKYNPEGKELLIEGVYSYPKENIASEYIDYGKTVKTCSCGSTSDGKAELS